MSLIRSESVVALDEIIVAARTCIAHHRQCANHVDDPSNAEHLRRFADRLERQSEKLADHIRATDDFPHAPADESLLVDEAAMRLKLSLTEDKAAALGEMTRSWRDALARAIDLHAPKVKGTAADDVRTLRAMLDAAER